MLCDLASFTPSHHFLLRAALHSHGAGVKGVQRDGLSHTRYLMHLPQYMALGLSLNEAIKRVSIAEMIRPATVREVTNSFLKHHLLPVDPTPRPRGIGSPLHPLYREGGPSLEAEVLIHRHLVTVKEKNFFESSTTLAAALQQELNMFVCPRTVINWLHQLGYSYGKKKFVGALKPAYKAARIRKFIYEYAVALREEENKKAVIVYTDESYIHQYHCVKKLWYSPFTSNKDDTQGDDGGKRLIILHAMTKDGMMAEQEEAASNLLTEEYHSCELVFNEVGTDIDEDYHKSIDSEAYMLWIRNRLLATFQSLYRGKKMYLVLDNASYHRPHGADWITPSKMDKQLCYSYLDTHNVEYKLNETVPVLKEKIKYHLESHPHINRTELEKLMSEHGHELIYTPPFVPEVQPIELLWADIKQQVARQATTKRKLEETRAQREEAIERITKEQCEKVIQHCHKWIEEFMKSELGSSLNQYPSLPHLIHTDPSSITASSPECCARGVG